MRISSRLIGAVTIASAVCAGAFLASGQAASDEKKPDFSYRQPSPEEMQKMVEAYTTTMQPSRYHKWLEQLVGEWDATATMWAAGPDAPPAKSKGSAKIEWAVPGKWLHQEFEGSMAGVPMKGFGVSGYDNFKKKFVGSWFDSMSTSLLTFEGLLDRTGTVLNQWGLMDEPMTGEHDKTVRYTTRIVDGNRFTFEIHDLAIGGESTKVIEVEYTRKK